jgi:UDP-galactopyranose mutase
VQSLADQSIKEPQNFEEQALKFVGRELYEAFFHGYTRKHWGCDPREIPASVLARLPVRFNYDDNYYDSTYQGIPRDGYTNIVSNILRHPAIEVRLGERFHREQASEFAHVIFTGPIDAWFNHVFGRLGYRTVTFERIDADGDYQGNAVINYTDLSVPYTRIHEHKHFAPWENHDKTISFAEFSKATEPSDTPYYPIRGANDKALLERYRELGRNEKGVSFLGRLATYRYLDMDKVIAEALDFAPAFLEAFSKPLIPQFPSGI